MDFVGTHMVKKITAREQLVDPFKVAGKHLLMKPKCWVLDADRDQKWRMLCSVDVRDLQEEKS